MKTVTVGSGATVQIVPAGSPPFVLIANTHATSTLFLQLDNSASTLTTSNGFPLLAGASLMLTSLERRLAMAPILGISSAGNIDVRVAGDEP